MYISVIRKVRFVQYYFISYLTLHFLQHDKKLYLLTLLDMHKVKYIKLYTSAYLVIVL